MSNSDEPVRAVKKHGPLASATGVVDSTIGIVLANNAPSVLRVDHTVEEPTKCGALGDKTIKIY